MFLDLLHFGSGSQALHYFVACLIAVTGTLQWVAARYCLRDLLWFEGRAGYVIGPLAILGGLGWFFVVDDQVFIPGLAGGELFLIFASAFFASVSLTRLINAVLARAYSPVVISKTRSCEKEPSA